jgi:hypothetical protein
MCYTNLKPLPGIHVILTAALLSQYYYYAHFIEEETSPERLSTFWRAHSKVRIQTWFCLLLTLSVLLSLEAAHEQSHGGLEAK